MANTRKIIDIDVKDEGFKKFVELFNKYSEKLEDMPEAWKKLDDAMNGAGREFVETGKDANSSLAEAASSASMVVEGLERAIKAQKSFGKETANSEKSMTKLSKAASVMGGSIFGVGKFLMKLGTMGGIGSALAGIGSGLGLADLADVATSQARTARGLGMSTGAVNAWRVNMAPYVGMNVLSGTANAQVDLTKQQYLVALGISPRQAQTQNAAQLVNQEIGSIREAWKKNPNFNSPQIQAALALGYGYSDIRNIVSANGGQLAGAERSSINQAGQLGFSGKVAGEWQQLSVALQTAKVSVESSLITGLSGLASPLAKLSNEVSRFISAFIQKDGSAVADEIGKGIKWLGDYLGSPKFSSDIQSFISNISLVGDEIEAVAQKLKWILPSQSVAPPDANARISSGQGKSIWYNLTHPGKTLFGSPYDFTAPEKQYGLPAGYLQALATVESSNRPGAVSSKGARGMFQIMPDVAAKIGVDPFDVGQSAYGVAYLTAQNMKMYGGDLKKAIAAYNWGSSNVNADIKSHGKDWLKYAPEETKNEVSRILALLPSSKMPSTASQNHAGSSGLPASVENLVKTLATQKTHVVITNHTNSRVHVNANAASK